MTTSIVGMEPGEGTLYQRECNRESERVVLSPIAQSLCISVDRLRAGLRVGFPPAFTERTWTYGGFDS